MLAMLAGVTLVAACGPGGPETVGSDTTITTASPPSTDARYATGADDLLIRVDSGYGPALPALAVAGDGSVYAPAPPGGLAAPPPGPPATEVSVRRLTPEGLQLVMNRAAGLGLLGTPPDYDTDEAPTDQSYTTVTITDRNGRYVHRAYALGTVDPGSSDARDALDLFVGELHDLERRWASSTSGPLSTTNPSSGRCRSTAAPGAAGRPRIGSGRSKRPSGTAARRSSPSAALTSPAPTQRRLTAQAKWWWSPRRSRGSAEAGITPRWSGFEGRFSLSLGLGWGWGCQRVRLSSAAASTNMSVGTVHSPTIASCGSFVLAWISDCVPVWVTRSCNIDCWSSCRHSLPSDQTASSPRPSMAVPRRWFRPSPSCPSH